MPLCLLEITTVLSSRSRHTSDLSNPFGDWLDSIIIDHEDECDQASNLLLIWVHFFATVACRAIVPEPDDPESSEADQQSNNLNGCLLPHVNSTLLFPITVTYLPHLHIVFEKSKLLSSIAGSTIRTAQGPDRRRADNPWLDQAKETSIYLQARAETTFTIRQGKEPHSCPSTINPWIPPPDS